jgi:DNA-binding protein HU-beta
MAKENEVRIGKGDFIDEIQQRAEIPTKAMAERAVNAGIDVIMETMSQGGVVSIPGFGSFRVVEVAARKGHNIQTGKPIEIAAHKKVRFTPGKHLSETVWSKDK